MLDLVLDSLTAIRTFARRVRERFPRLAGDRRIAGILVAGSTVVLTGTVLLVAVLLDAPDGLAPLGVGPPPNAAESTPETGTPSTEATVSPAGSPILAAPSPSATPRAASVLGPPSAPRGLTARYSTENSTLVNYVGAVAITNPGRKPTLGWTVAITLPRHTLTISAVAGAKVRRDGATWIFEPDQNTRQVPAGGSVQVRFRVDGTTVGSAPTACTIDGRACQGIAS